MPSPPASSPADPWLGQTLGNRYRLVAQIGAGGMGVVYRAWDLTHDRYVVVKMPLQQLLRDPQFLARFEQELSTLQTLSHKSVVPIIDVGVEQDTPYAVMPYLAGGSLKQRIRVQADGQAVSDDPSMLWLWLPAIAHALDEVHGKGFVHRDVKPSNVLFRPSGEAVLIDYGLAHHRDLPDLLQEEFRLPYGTAPYMAPEQVMGIRSDPRSDIFALGCLMYFFATGVRPFGDPQKLKGLKQRLWRDPVPPRKLNPEIPPWFQEVVLRCLEVRAGRRYPNAAQLAHDLRHPDQVQLTARAEKRERDGFFATLRRRGEAPHMLIDPAPERAPEASDAPIVAAAVNLDDMTPELAEQLRRTALRILERAPDARLAVLNVLKLNRIALDQTLDEDGHNKHIQRLVGLKDWARPMKISQGRITYHVLEAIDPADTLLDYARVNNVDHIVMGARANSTMRKILGSVSGKVAMEAPCTVTVVRVRGAEG